MKNLWLIKSGMILIALTVTLSSTAYADRNDRDRRDDREQRDDRDHRDNRDNRSNRQQHDNRDSRDRRNIRVPVQNNLYLDNRFRHDHYYPRRGEVVTTLPSRRHLIRYRDHDYYYYGGVWYNQIGLRIVVVAPPLGVVVPVLPPYYTTLWLHGTPYYYANDVYYVWRPDMNGYVVSKPPVEPTEQELPLLADELYIYPKKGQSEQQQADDRYECHQWGVKESGFDPTKPPENISVSESSRKRDDYQRAMKACLEGRDYSVQ